MWSLNEMKLPLDLSAEEGRQIWYSKNSKKWLLVQSPFPECLLLTPA